MVEDFSLDQEWTLENKMKSENLNSPAAQINSRESVDLSNFWKIATLGKGEILGVYIVKGRKIQLNYRSGIG